MRKIAVVTGTRAEYGYLKPLMSAINKENDLELIPIITGMHLLKDFGDTYKIVEKDFPNSIKVPMPLKDDTLLEMARYFSYGIKNIAEFLNGKKPDIVVVLGDRSEAFAAALAAMYLNIPVAHINGGDVSGGTVDESIRHAITKISHIHLVHTKDNYNRLIKMGEEKERIFVTGALSLDVILNKKLKTKNEIFKKYDLNPDKTTFLVVQHPITTQGDKGYGEIEELFLALNQKKEQTVMIYPNCDSGCKKFIKLIEKYSHKNYLHVFKNLPHEDYLSLMKYASLMIGNSSSGIIEAPSLKTPVINIGNRQEGRERSNNIIDVEADKNKIIESIDYALYDKEFLKKVKTCKNKFGDGKTSKRIVNIFKNVKIDEKLIQKRITY